MRRRLGGPRPLILLGLLLITVGLAVTVMQGYGTFRRVKGHLVSLRGHLQTMESFTNRAPFDAPSFEAGTFAAVKEALGGARADLMGLKAELGPFLTLCPHLGWVPRWGGDIQAAPELLEIGLGVSTAGELAFDSIEPLFQLLAEGGDREARGLPEEVVQVLDAARPQLLAAQQELDRVARARGKVNEARLSPRLARLVTRLDKYLPAVQMAVQGALLAPELLGASEPKTYLILAQNEDERRATGGFISGVGLLRLHRGKVLALEFQDSYAVDNLSKPHGRPPEPLEMHMGAQMWLFRDANWSPDFPTAAQVAAAIYEQDQGVAVDGVVAVDQAALGWLVGALGPLETEVSEVPLTGDNVIQEIRRFWASPRGQGQTGDWWQHRKDFMDALVQAMMARLEADADLVEVFKLTGALRQALEERHIQVALKEPAAARILARNHWDGAILPAEGDYLLVVNTNMGFNKVNPNVQESIDYRVSLGSNSGTRAEVTVRYDNRSQREARECVQEPRYEPTYAEMMHGCYWDYLRLYVPQGSQLLEATRTPLPPGSLFRRLSGSGEGTGEPTVGPPEKGKEVFATFFVVAPGESRDIRFLYELPQQVVKREGEHRRYSLFIQKQASTVALPVRVTVELPPGAEFVAAQPMPSSVEGNVIRFQLALFTDQPLELIFR